MQFKAIALFAASAWAQSMLQFTTFPPNPLPVGQSVTVDWTGATAGTPVTILLRAGNPGNLDTIQTLTASATGTSYTFALPSTLADRSDYALQIVQGDMNNYTPQFAVSGGTGSAVSSSAALLSSVTMSASSVLSSASSVLASLTSSAAASSTSGSALVTSTIPSSSVSRASSTVASTTRTTSSAGATSTGSGAAHNNVQSPLALILGAVAAMVYFQ